MNLNDLMEVWRSQDTSPLHGVNETLLRLALRHDATRLQTEQRWGKRITYFMSAVFVAVMAFFLFVMIRDNLTGWDLVIPIVGAVAALLWPSVMQTWYRAQARREQSFGESLRDQLNRHIAQLDYYARIIASPAYHVANNLPAMVWSVALFFATLRINETPLSHAWTDPRLLSVGIGTFVFCAIAGGATIWIQRRWMQQHLLPHRRRLRALLKELDGE